jgi:hypothetical protein
VKFFSIELPEDNKITDFEKMSQHVIILFMGWSGLYVWTVEA